MTTSTPLNKPTQTVQPEKKRAAKQAPKPETIIVQEKKHSGIIKTLRSASFNTDWQRWFAVSQIKVGFSFLLAILKDIIQRHRPMRAETFEQAVVRLKLTPDDIKVKIKQRFYSSILYLSLSILLIAYGVFIAVSSGLILATALCIILSIMALVFSFREHFWYTQIKNRRLGCTFKDWFNLTFRKANTKTIYSPGEKK